MQASKTETGRSNIGNRLKRAGGHLQNVLAMVDAGEPCEDVIQQLHAVERAITAAKKSLIHGHLELCVAGCSRQKSAKSQAAMAQFKSLVRYL